MNLEINFDIKYSSSLNLIHCNEHCIRLQAHSNFGYVSLTLDWGLESKVASCFESWYKYYT